MISTQFLLNCQAGDENAIETLVRTHQRSVFQLALSILDDAPVDGSASTDQVAVSIADAAAEAETATRETFTAALDRLGRYREDTPFATWLFSIAIDISRRRARRWKMRRWWRKTTGRLSSLVIRRQPNMYEKPMPDPLHFLPGDIEMWSAVRSLDDKMRIPVVLRYYHDFPIQEIARLLHLSEGAVHARLDAAREKIAVKLDK